MNLIAVFLGAILISATHAQADCPNLTGTFTGLVEGKKSTMVFYSNPGDCSQIYLASSESDNAPAGHWFDLSSNVIVSESSDRTYYSRYSFQGDCLVIKSWTQMKKVGFCIEPKTNRRLVTWCPADVIEENEMSFRLIDGKLNFKISSKIKGESKGKIIILNRVSQ